MGTSSISMLRGDIVDQDADAIVNAANSSLYGGGGVDGAIHARGGPQILAECRRVRQTLWPNGLPTVMAAATGGGNFKARIVIHTVGPIWSGGLLDEPRLLSDCYRNCLAVANQNSVKSIAFPGISIGAYGYPLEAATRIALSTVREFAEKKEAPEKIAFVLFDERTLQVYRQTAAELDQGRLDSDGL